MTDFLTIDYLKIGTNKQQKAFEVLNENLIFQNLSEFTPVLVGTIPLNIDIPSSDLDIACYWKDKNHFEEIIKNAFGKERNFQISETSISGEATIIANFFLGNFEIEIFGQHIPVSQQNGFRHMTMEYQILEEQGEEFRKKIIKLKMQGYKTEPAFAKLLHLSGNPYEAILNFKKI